MNFDINFNHQSAVDVLSQSFHMPLPLLQSAVDEAQNNIMAPRALIFMSALTAIAVVVQGLIDVRKPNGQVVPTSLMLLAIANSGERKSTVENVFLGPVRDFQQQQSLIYQSQVQQWQVQHDIWSTRRKAILKGINKKAGQGQPTQDDEQQLLVHQANQPVEPKAFKLLYEDSTSEALFLGLHENLPTAGLTSSEGGGVLGGRAFNDLSKMNSIWSGDSITVDRKTAKSFVLNGARLTVSIMAQESAVSDYIKRRGEASRGVGLWARFLVCHPQSTQGYRVRLNGTQSWEHRGYFVERMTELLQQNVVLLQEPAREKQVIKFTSEAADRWHKLFNDIEQAIRPGGQFEGAGDHASKLADNIARVAALLHCFEKLDGDIALNTLDTAIDFCRSSSNDFLKLFMPPPQECLDADELDNWLDRVRNTGERLVRKNYIRQHCPNKLREKNRLDRALEVLCRNGRISFCDVGRSACVDVMPWFLHHQPLPNMPQYNKI
ncbi:DUF3987 domain-containing protein [Pseudomonas sp. ANT_H14]|uniref:YfjI family protein n=1 Tax=unclassified Pseudomonas TaxID=196821 RepID=UPI0011EFC179|nr:MULTISPECIES: YfjI family protein [unclassified Pseudomonas]KAA0943747.1 DUF3987 domain-containing protein [Pseudomonas sp. ANT_H4]KAA0950110.1 DUF3987 domain-containing protein [Pseudomonas sp. ANT_H14]